MAGWCFIIKAMKCQALHQNSVIKTRCHPLVTGWKCTYITAVCWESSSTSGKNPSKINLQLMNFKGKVCWTITNITILAQINVKVFIPRDKIFRLPKSIFKAVDTLRTVFFPAFTETKLYWGMESNTYPQIFFSPHPMSLKPPWRTPQAALTLGSASSFCTWATSY